MKEQESQITESATVQAFYKLRPQDPEELETLKSSFESLYLKKFDELYIANNKQQWRILPCYIFFILASDEVFKKFMSQAKLTKLVPDLQQRKMINKIREKVKINCDDIGILNQIWKKINVISTHKLLFAQAASKLSKQECEELMTAISSGHKKVRIEKRLKKGSKIQFKQKVNANLFGVILQTDKMSYFVLYELYEQQKPHSSIKQVNKSSIQQQIQSPKSPLKLEKEPERKSQIKSQISSEEQSDPKNKTKKRKSPKKVSKLSNPTKQTQQIEQLPKIETKLEIPWYQVLVIVMIILAVVAEFTDFFDQFLYQYNENMGHYYLLEVGYKLNDLFFASSFAQNL